jgi:hypothetical protein
VQDRGKTAKVRDRKKIAEKNGERELPINKKYSTRICRKKRGGEAF